MFDIEWGSVEILFVEMLVTALAIYGTNKSRKIRSFIWRAPSLLLCGFLTLVGSFAVLASIGLSSCNTYSGLVYSPSGNFAARTVDFDQGATGGETDVTLHWARGMRSQTVYSGGWKSVVPSDIKWTNDSELTIYYDAGYGALTHPCSSTPQVKISCNPR